MKHTPSTLLATLCAFLLCGGALAECGDCNQDGMTDDVLDALEASRVDVGLAGATPQQMIDCDVNADGFISMVDALVLAQSAVGLPAALTCPNTPPSATSCALNDVGASVIIDYTLVDDQSDLLDIVVEYSVDGGAIWNPATADPCCGDGLVNLTSSPVGVAHTVYWDHTADLQQLCGGLVDFRITPMDAAGPGASCVVSGLDLCNNSRPEAVQCGINDVTQNSAIISYMLVDAESDTCSITIEFSTDSGATWSPATENMCCGDGLTNLSSSPGGTVHSVWWMYSADLPAGCGPSPRFRITPSDTSGVGIACDEIMNPCI